MHNQTSITDNFALFPVDVAAIGAAIRMSITSLPLIERGSNVDRLVELCADAFRAIAIPEPDPTAVSDFDITVEQLGSEQRLLQRDIDHAVRTAERLGARLLMDDESTVSSDVAILPGVIAATYPRDPVRAEDMVRRIVDLATGLKSLEKSPKRGRPPRQIDLPMRIVHAVAVYCDEDPNLTFTPGWSTQTKEVGGKRERLSDDDLTPPTRTVMLTETVFRAVGLFTDRPALKNNITRYRDIFLDSGRSPTSVDLQTGLAGSES